MGYVRKCKYKRGELLINKHSHLIVKITRSWASPISGVRYRAINIDKKWQNRFLIREERIDSREGNWRSATPAEQVLYA